MIKDEIDEIKWISPKEFLVEISKNPKIYCPWMLIAIEYLDKSEKSVLEKYRNILSEWMTKSMKEELRDAIKIHMRENDWRFLK